jgi:hypothetical protein
LALTSPTSGSRSVGIDRLRTKATEFSFSFLVLLVLLFSGYSKMLLATQVLERWMILLVLLMSDELERMWKEAAVI